MRVFAEVPFLLDYAESKGYTIPEGTMRRWAAQAEQQHPPSGHVRYLISDLFPHITAWAAREDLRRTI